MSISDAIRILLVRIANDGRMPFDLAAPWAQRAELKDDNILIRLSGVCCCEAGGMATASSMSFIVIPHQVMA
ncbi:MAG: type II toxin-antitoxin system RelB/DinJ family antitoxin [Actinomycetaceae bacterium]|nr:type II toxin-antitoxin system RelB/DinJ family antitoxin [Actinomycetaceae bacterium]